MEPGEIYFWTATIHKWQPLLTADSYKDIIIGSLSYLSRNAIMDIFAFVIMPTHLHLICRTNKNNGKETGRASFLKYTAHEFKKKLNRENPGQLWLFDVRARNKGHEFWQRDSLAIPLYTKQAAYQKLDYVHNNPLSGHWRLVTDPCKYNYSSASFYEQNDKRFRFLKDLREEF